MNSLSDNAPLGYIIYDGTSNIVGCNSTACKYLDYLSEDLNEHRFDKILTTAGRIFFQTHIIPMVKLQGSADEIFLSLKKKDGETLPIVSNTKQIEENGNVGYHFVFIPVPTRRKYEDALLSARQKAESELNDDFELTRTRQTVELQAKALDEHMYIDKLVFEDLQQLTYIINHDMQECVRKMIIFSERAENKSTPELLRKISMTANRLKAINNTLDLYVKTLRPEKEFFEDVDLNSALAEGLKMALSETEFQQVNLSVVTLPAVSGLSKQLVQVFYQLFSNSIKFRKNEEVNVSVDHVVFDSNSYKASKDKYLFSEFLRLTFSDDGKGFDEFYNEYVFNLLKKIDSGNDGSLGVGLAICKKILNNHLGEISISSTPGAGTVVTLVFPLAKNK